MTEPGFNPIKYMGLNYIALLYCMDWHKNIYFFSSSKMNDFPAWVAYRSDGCEMLKAPYDPDPIYIHKNKHKQNNQNKKQNNIVHNNAMCSVLA